MNGSGPVEGEPRRALGDDVGPRAVGQVHLDRESAHVGRVVGDLGIAAAVGHPRRDRDGLPLHVRRAGQPRRLGRGRERPLQQRALGVERAIARMAAEGGVGGVDRVLRGEGHRVSRVLNSIPALRSRSISFSPIATAGVSWPESCGRSSWARHSADSASIFDVSP